MCPTYSAKTYMAKPGEISKEWICIDAEGVVVGRLASYVATLLKGKHKPSYTPHIDCGDAVIIINADKVVFTGKKRQQKTYYHHSGHPGGLKKRSADHILSGKHPDRVIRQAIKRMLSKGPLARQQLRNLRVYVGPEHPHQAQNPSLLNFRDINQKNTKARPTNYPMAFRHDRIEDGVKKATGQHSEKHIKAETLQWLSTLTSLQLELDNSHSKRLAHALNGIIALCLKIDADNAIHNKKLRMELRGLPDRLLGIMCEQLTQPDIACLAATALTTSVHPTEYVSPDDLKTERLREDFERLMTEFEIDSFVTSSLEPVAPSNSLRYSAQIWNELPFELNGRSPKLPKCRWHTDGGEFAASISGANVKASETRTDELLKGQCGSIRMDFEPLKSSQLVIIHLKHNGNVFDTHIFSVEDFKTDR